MKLHENTFVAEEDQPELGKWNFCESLVTDNHPHAQLWILAKIQQFGFKDLFSVILHNPAFNVPRTYSVHPTIPMISVHVICKSNFSIFYFNTQITVRSRANGIPFSDQLQEIPGIFPFARIPISSRITCKEIGFPFWCFGAFECSKLSHLTRNVPIFNHSAWFFWKHSHFLEFPFAHE